MPAVHVRFVSGAAALLVAFALLGTAAAAQAAPLTVPSPISGGWKLLGSSTVVSSTSAPSLQLTDASAAGKEAGTAYYPTTVAGPGITGSFDAVIGSGTGADGLTMMLADASAGIPVLGVDGGGLGFSGNKGLAVALDTYKNAANPSNNFVGVATGAGAVADQLKWGATSTNVPALRGSPVHVSVATTTTGLTISVNGTQVINYTTAIPANVYVGFTGGDGGLTDRHAVENVSITASPGSGGGAGMTSGVPSPISGGWKLLGSSTVVSSTSPPSLQLTDASAAGKEAGTAYYPTTVAGPGITASFDAVIGSGTGADGLTMMLADASAGIPVLGVDGGGLGFSGNKGLAVALDTYKNAANPSNNFVGVATGAGAVADQLKWGATSTNVPALRGSPVHVSVATTTTGLTISVNGTQVINYTTAIPANVYVGFTGGDGGLTDRHAVENVSITASPGSGGAAGLSGSATTLATYLHDDSRSGYNASETQLTAANASSLKLDWTDTGGSGGFSQPTILNGVVYWGDWTGEEHATNAATGVDLWKTYLGTTTPPPSQRCNPPEAGIVGTATLAQVGSTTVVYVPGGDAAIYALNAATGAVLWRTSLGTPPDWFIWGSPALTSDSLYIGLASYGDCPLTQGYVARINPDTGVVLNTFATVSAGCVGGGLSSSPAVDADGSVYVTTGTDDSACPGGEPHSEAILKLNKTLALVSAWQIPNPLQVGDADFIATPTLFTATINGQPRSLVGAANKNGVFYALDRTNLAAGPVWHDVIAAGGSCPQCAGSGAAIAPAAFDGTNLFIAGPATTINGSSCGGSIQEVDPATGTFVWRRCLSGIVLSTIAEVPGVVSVGDGTHLLAVRASDGTSLFDYTASGLSFFYGAPNIAGGMLYAVNYNGNLMAFGH